MKLFKHFTALAVVMMFPLMAAPIKVGVTAGPHAQIMAHIVPLAKKQGINLQVIEFQDFILPNIALSEKDLDANCYQHQPFLDVQMKERGFAFASLGKTILLPMGVFSSKIKDIKDLPHAGKVAIPNDPTNGGRALLLLQKLGLITLQPSAGLNPSVIDITENARNLKIVEVEAPQVPRSLDDVDMAVINMDWILVAGLDPNAALAKESTDSPYANLFVVRSEDLNNPTLKKIMALYQSQDTETFIEKTFKGAVLPAW